MLASIVGVGRAAGALSSLPDGIADLGGAAAHQHDRPVAGLLQPAQHHDLHQAADMQAVGRAVEADIGDDAALRRPRVEGRHVGALMHEAALAQRPQKVGSEPGHGTCVWTLLRRRDVAYARRLGQFRRGGTVYGGQAWRATTAGVHGTRADERHLARRHRRRPRCAPTASAHVELGPRAHRALRRGVPRAAPRGVLGGVGAGRRRRGRALTVAACRGGRRACSTTAASRAADVDVIGFHGQTILHRPAERRTWQIGDGALLARADRHRRGRRFPQPPTSRPAGRARRSRRSTMPRAAELARAAGRRAQHRRRRQRHLDRPGATRGRRAEAIVAFDTGPGNALIDDWVRTRTGQAWDLDGALARAGPVDERALARAAGQSLFRRCRRRNRSTATISIRRRSSSLSAPTARRR